MNETGYGMWRVLQRTALMPICLGWLLASLVGCGSLFCQSQSDVLRQRGEAQSFTSRSLQQALQAEGLSLVTLRPQQVLDGEAAEAFEPGPNQWVWRTNDHDTRRLEFVRDGEGRLYRLVRQPDWIDSSSVTQCGCRPGGKGTAPMPIARVYQGVVGDKRVSYTGKKVDVSYAKSNCPAPL